MKLARPSWRKGEKGIEEEDGFVTVEGSGGEREGEERQRFREGLYDLTGGLSVDE